MLHDDSPPRQRRRSIRLPTFDYRDAGAYFVTVVTAQRTCIFGDIIDDVPVLSAIGELANRHWIEIAAHRPNVDVDEFVVMPNHVHGILWNIGDVNDAGMTSHAPTPRRFSAPRANSLSAVVAAYKAGVTRDAHEQGWVSAIWQRGFYEHIIRNEAALRRIRKYIVDNPTRWADDEENPNRAR